MDVENVKIVDGLIFGYLSRRQYRETLRALCNEAPCFRDGSNRFQSGCDVFIQVNDHLHDKNLEQIISAFSVVGHFDVTPELIDFGIRLRDLTNEFSTMTAVRGRSISDNQMKLYGKRSFTKTLQTRQVFGSTSFQCVNSQSDPYRPIVYCESQVAKEPDYAEQFHNTRSSELVGEQFVGQQELNYEYQSQPHTSSYTLPVVPPYVSTQLAVQNSAVTTAQEVSSQNTPTYKTSQLIAHEQSTHNGEEPMLIDYGINVKSSATSDIGPELDLATANCTITEVGESDGPVQTQLSTSFSSESGAHKRKAAVPHRRDELVAHTAQSLIIPNGVLVDLDSNGVVNNSASQVSLLSNIDDSAMQCLDRLINGNLDEVFPFCEDHDQLSNFAATICNPYSETQTNGNELGPEETQQLFNESVPSLDVNPSVSLPLVEEHSSKCRSVDEGEIISDESLQLENPQKPDPFAQIDARSDDFEILTGREHSTTLRNEFRRSSLDSGKAKRYERKVADRLKEFNRNPPKTEVRIKKSTVCRTEMPDAVIHEARNVPRVSPPSGAGGRLPRSSGRCFASLFNEACSASSSRESSPPHRDKVNKKEEERRRREKEMERERQRDKERIKRQRHDRDTYRGKERFHRPSPDRKSMETRVYRRDEEEKKESREKERKRELGEELRISDDPEKKRGDEKARRESQKKRKEEELEARRQSEYQRRAEAMRRKEEEEKKRRQEKERQEEKKKEEERRRLEEEKLQKNKEEEQRKENDLGKVEEEERNEQMTNYAEDGHEMIKSSDEVDRDSVNSCGDSSSSDAHHTARNYSDEETASKRDFQTQEFTRRLRKVEVRKVVEPLDESVGPVENDDDAVSVDNEERLRKQKDEVRTCRNITDCKKSFPASATARRRDEVKKAVKPLEPGMMMSDTGVLDRINKEMESLVPRNRSRSTRSPEESSSVAKNTSSKFSKRDTPVDYNQVLFSNPPVIKRAVPLAEKRKVLVISSGLPTGSTNHLVFSKAHTSRLGMFLEKVSDKHKKFMDRENDRILASPAYEDSDRNEICSPVTVSQFPRQQQQKFAPQKRPLPASSLDSYLGSPKQNSPDIRDGETTTSRLSGKKSKIDLSKMPDIIEKLYSGKSV